MPRPAVKKVTRSENFAKSFNLPVAYFKPSKVYVL